MKYQTIHIDYISKYDVYNNNYKSIIVIIIATERRETTMVSLLHRKQR